MSEREITVSSASDFTDNELVPRRRGTAQPVPGSLGVGGTPGSTHPLCLWPGERGPQVEESTPSYNTGLKASRSSAALEQQSGGRHMKTRPP